MVKFGYLAPMTPNSKKTSFVYYFLHSPAFPQLHFVGIIGILYAIVQGALGNYTQAGFFMILSILIMLLRSWSRLDIKNKTLTDFFLLIPYRKLKIQHISSIRVAENVVNQTLNSRGSTSTIRFDIYRLLLVTDSESIILKESKDKGRLLKKAGQIALTAKVQLDDRTSNR